MPMGPPTQIQEQPLQGPVPRFEIPGWLDRFGVVAGVTGRGDENQPFDLGLWTERPVGEVMGRWRQLRSAEPGFSAHVLGNQVHGTRVVWHDRVIPGWTQIEGVDGHATSTPGIMLYVTVADCVPIYLVNSRTGSVALLHSGWRGTAGEILTWGVEALSHRGKCSPADIVMHCGVCICKSCYEVGSEVIEALGLEASPEGKAQADLPGVLAQQAGRLGIGEVSTSGWCSAHDRSRFFSHRASRGADGRMVAYLGILPGARAAELPDGQPV
jgi:YfiH family protein